MMLNDENRKSMKKMMAGRSLYIALGVCLLAAGAVGFSAVRNMAAPKVTVPQTTEKTTYVNHSTHVFTDPTHPAQTPVYETAAVTEPVTEYPHRGSCVTERTSPWAIGRTVSPAMPRKSTPLWVR